MMTTNMNTYNPVELMVVLLSREVRDNEISACGALSHIPAAGMLLAKELHARNAVLIILNSIFNPFKTSRQFHYLAQRGELGLFFVSGVQIDQYANYNLHQLGPDHAQPDVRFPGGYGGGLIYYAARRSVAFRTEHTKRSFVENVDYISAAGSSPEDTLRLGGPSKVITPKVTFMFNRKTNRLELESIHAGFTLEEIVNNTGFAVSNEHAIQTAEPSELELYTLRNIVRQRMINTNTYAKWAENSLN
jgi:glutaconate CoA-transferase subunit B